MPARKLYQQQSVLPRDITLAGTITIGASGAISAQTGAKLCGATAAQTASEDGRYSVTFDRTYKRIKSANVNMVGPDDNAFPTTTGSDPQIRLLTTSGFSIQAKRTDTQADTDPASGSILCWTAVVSLV